MKGFIDTGNFAYDEKTGLPIMFVNLRSIIDKMPENIKNCFLFRDHSEMGGRRVTVAGINGQKNEVTVFDRAEVYIDNVQYDLSVGICENGVAKYDVVLPSVFR